jgi:hypothetical protein
MMARVRLKAGLRDRSVAAQIFYAGPFPDPDEPTGNPASSGYSTRSILYMTGGQTARPARWAAGVWEPTKCWSTSAECYAMLG